jgi:hypothetical protein
MIFSLFSDRLKVMEGKELKNNLINMVETW